MATTTKPTEDYSGDESNTAIWVALALVVLVGTVLALLSWSPPDATDEAVTKAEDLVASMDAAGMQRPDADVIAQVYGTDGGALCTSTGGRIAEQVGTLAAARGGGEVNIRPGLIDPRVVQYGRLVVNTYCPSRADEYDDYVRDLRVRRTREALNQGT